MAHSPYAPRSPKVAGGILLLSLLVASAAPARAQCPAPDQLDGPPGTCCTAAQPQLPPFPAINTDAVNICWRNCAIDQVINCTAEFGVPIPAQTAAIPPVCTVFTAKLRIRDTGGTIKWRSRVRMWYSRTWVEIDPAGNDIQVWRLLVNGDLRPDPAAGAPPCPVPACAPVFNNRVRFTGYIDYALDCTTNTFSSAWMLNHDCDRLDHRNGFPRGGNFHGNRSFTFVGPGSTFAPSAIHPVESGASGFEAIRRMTLPVPGTAAVCDFEEPVGNAAVTPLIQVCACGGGPNQYVASDLFASSACGSTVTNVTSQFPKAFVSKSLGMWTDPGTYPGLEILRWNMGAYDYTDCAGVTRAEVFFGVTTIRGYTAFQLTSAGVGAQLPGTFIDQGNSLSFPANVTTMNVEYVSDHILNLNF